MAFATAELPELQRLIEGRLPRWLAELEQSYGLETPASFDEACRSWGLMPHAEYRAALRETIERDYRPRFAEYGIEVQTSPGG